MRFKIIVALHGRSDPAERIALMQWTVTRLVDALRESPVPITVELEPDTQDRQPPA